MPLLLTTAALTYAVFNQGGVYLRDWCIVTLVVAATALHTVRRPHTIPWPVFALPAYAAFQLIPLPHPLLKLLSPARAALNPDHGWSPLAVTPPAALEIFLYVLACTLAFLTIRWLARDRNPWPLAAPLIALAALEAALGLCQPAPAHGTYVNRNHYAGLLEMALPFAVMYPIHVLRRGRSRWSSPLRPALVACAGFGLAALILLGIIASLSRMGFIAAILALSVLALSGLRRLPLAAVIGLALFVYLPTDALLSRFETVGVSYQGRAAVWSESLPLLAAYPVFGTGLGGYESAFMSYKLTTPLLTDDYVHNDYLQAAIETGVVGTLILAALFTGIVRQALRSAAARDPLDVACLAALTAIGLHSIVDFNLYIPANAMVLAWIAALVTGGATTSSEKGSDHLFQRKRSGDWHFDLFQRKRLSDPFSQPQPTIYP